MHVVDLKAERLNRGLTLSKAEALMDLEAGHLLRIEQGQRLGYRRNAAIAEPRPRTKLKIASFYGHKVTDIWPVREAGEPEPREAA